MNDTSNDGARDQALSNRHRTYGLMKTDIDFTLCEYESGSPSAIIEYKYRDYNYQYTNGHTHKPKWLDTSYNFIALRMLCDYYSGPGGAIPFAVVCYWRDPWNYVAYPMNAPARKYFVEGIPMTEREFVGKLYEIRGRVIPPNVENLLDNVDIRKHLAALRRRPTVVMNLKNKAS